MEALKGRLLGEGLRGWQAGGCCAPGAELAGGFPAPASAAASRPTPLPPRRSDLPYLSAGERTPQTTREWPLIVMSIFSPAGNTLSGAAGFPGRSSKHKTEGVRH